MGSSRGSHRVGQDCGKSAILSPWPPAPHKDLCLGHKKTVSTRFLLGLSSILGIYLLSYITLGQGTTIMRMLLKSRRQPGSSGTHFNPSTPEAEHMDL